MADIAVEDFSLQGQAMHLKSGLASLESINDDDNFTRTKTSKFVC